MPWIGLAEIRTVGPKKSLAFVAVSKGDGLEEKREVTDAVRRTLQQPRQGDCVGYVLWGDLVR